MRSLRTKSGRSFNRTNVVSWLSLKHRFGWRYTTCLWQTTRLENTKSPPSANRTCSDSASTWMKCYLTSYLCWLICWEVLKSWTFSKSRRRSPPPTLLSSKCFLKSERACWPTKTGIRLQENRLKHSLQRTPIKKKLIWIVWSSCTQAMYSKTSLRILSARIAAPWRRCDALDARWLGIAHVTAKWGSGRSTSRSVRCLRRLRLARRLLKKTTKTMQQLRKICPKARNDRLSRSFDLDDWTIL